MKFTKNTLLVLSALALANPVYAAGTIATVNGKPIKQSIYDFISKDAASRGQKISEPMKQQIIGKLVSSELIYQEAQRKGFDKKADYIIKEELGRRELLVNTFLQDYIKNNPVSDAETKSEYEKLKAKMGDKEYNARHILVSTEAEAKTVIAELNKGGDFAKIAKAKSKDTGSAKNGGSLGWFAPASMVKPFSDVVVKMKKGALTQAPVQTQFGWHIIKLENKRTSQPPKFDKVKAGIKKQLQQQKLAKYLETLKSQAKIVINK